MSRVTRCPWLIPVIAVVAAVALFVAGVVVWRMTSTPGPVSPGRRGIFFVYFPPPHRLHPLRAELLWAVSAVFALVAFATGLRQRGRPGRAQTVSG